MMLRALIILAFSFPFAVFSQEKSDTTIYEEIFITGNRIETPIQHSSQNIQVLTSEEIQQLPISSFNELLTFVGGVDIQQRGPFGTQADISMDGGTFEQTLILLDGIKLVNAQTAHNLLNLPIPVDAIDYIEIIHGPAAKQYGINALSGAINIVTKKKDYSFVDAAVYGGSSFEKQDPREGNGIYAGGGVDVTGNFGTQKQNHLVAISKKNYNGQRYNSGQDALQLFYNGNYNFNKKHSLHLLGGYSQNEFGANGFYAAPGDSNSVEAVKTALVSFSSQHQFGKLTILPGIHNRYDEDDYRYIKDMPTIGRSMHYTNALMAELNMRLETEIGTFGWGLDARFDVINSSNIGQQERDNYGAYLEYKGIFWEKLITTAGAYVNYNTSYDWQVYPGLDFAYLFYKNWKVEASVGSGQRIPSFTDLYLNQLPGNVGNPQLKPESAWQYDIGISHYSQKTKIRAGYFYRDVYDFIDWVRDSVSMPYSPMNFGNLLMHGVNLRVQQNFSFSNDQHLLYFINYNYLLPSYDITGNQQSKYVLSTLKHQFIVGLNYSIKGFAVQVTNRFVERELNTPYDLLDLRLSYEIKGCKVFADVTNILNSSYVEAGAVPLPNRWFRLGVRYQWNNK